jgi:3',5'-cyclic AMP phosphodiesterase CpdA
LLDSLGVPWVSVPGNHDLPLFRVAERLVRPLGAYRRVLAADVQPFWRRDGVEILGVNTARPYFWTEGRVDARQRARIRSAYRGTGLRVLALHHPVLRSASRPAAHLVRGLRPALRAAADARVDVVLCGHHHVPAHADLAALWPGIGRHMVGILSGTAVSTRTRAGQPASWTILDWDGADLLGLQVRQFDRGGFVDGAAGEWARSAAGWTLAASR